jgi:hypothetical protein
MGTDFEGKMPVLIEDVGEPFSRVRLPCRMAAFIRLPCMDFEERKPHTQENNQSPDFLVSMWWQSCLILKKSGLQHSPCIVCGGEGTSAMKP